MLFWFPSNKFRAMQIIQPEVGYSTPVSDHKFSDIYEKARVACQTALKLNDMGMPISVEPEDELLAEKIIKKEIKPTTRQIFTAGTAIKLGAILSEYDVEVAKNAAQLRTVATNKLIELLDDPDPKVRLRSVELIGKIADVGLFVERTEVTISSKSTNELEEDLHRLVNKYIDSEVTDVTELQDEELEEELDGQAREEEEGEIESEEEREGECST